MSKEEQLRHKRAVAQARVALLRETLVELNGYHESASKRLDATYYGVLERLGALQAALGGLRELAGLSGELGSRFDADAAAMAEGIAMQIEGFGQPLDDQEVRIQALQQRIIQGRDKVSRLSERVDVVRGEVEGWERADREWRDRTRTRLRAIWRIMIGVLCLSVLLYLGSQFAHPFTGAGDIGGGDMAVEGEATGAGRPSWIELAGYGSDHAALNMTEEVAKELRRRAAGGSSSTARGEDAAALRAFDEL